MQGFDKSQISAALSLDANSVHFDAKNAGNCISVHLDFKFFLGEYAHGPPPPSLAPLPLSGLGSPIDKFGTVSETSGSLGTNSSKHEQNKHGGRE